MRVSLPIIITSCLLVALITWLVSTRDKNFAKPPTPEQLVKISQDWEQDKPHIPPSQSTNRELLADQKKNTSPSSTAKSSLKPVKLPPLNLQHSPALSEYGTLGDKGGAFIIALATHLETIGQYQRALLAWERVIDTANPTEKERQQAVTAIKRLKNELPPWNPDQTNDIPLTLHAGAALKEKKNLGQALQSTADQISATSGNILVVGTKAAIGKSPDTSTPSIPVAIWFSSHQARAETPPVSFMIDPSQGDLLAEQISAGAYSLVRTHLARETNFSPLPELPANANPNDWLKYHVTRLMWREFVKSLKE